MDRPFSRRLRIGLFIALGILITGLIIANWVRQAVQRREQLRDTLAEIAASDRSQLSLRWGEKLAWTPSAEAPLALAVMPRTARKRMDALYACFEGQRVVATLGLTTVAGYVDGVAIDRRRYPGLLIERPLDSEEMRGLRLMIGLLEERVAQYQPQDDLHGWTSHVLATARAIEAAQSPPPNVSSGGAGP